MSALRVRRLSSPVGLATLAVATGVILVLILLLVDFSSLWPGYVIAAGTAYSWAAVATCLSARFARLTPWLLMAGIIPLVIWGFFVFFGAADFTPLIPVAIYCWAIARAFARS